MDHIRSQFALVSFADTRYKKTLSRLTNQAAAIPEISHTFFYDESCIASEYKKRARGRMGLITRGFGFWCWKPAVILMALKEMKLNEILCYCDAGFHLNPSGSFNIQRYLDPLLNGGFDIVAFSHDKFLLDSALQADDLSALSEASYTKGDMFDYWGVRNCDRVTHSPQYASGLFFLRNTSFVKDIINEWRVAALMYPHLFDDSPSATPNFPEFIEARHDQSYFSILCKLNHHYPFSAFEFWYPRGPNMISDWEIISAHPFLARRDKKHSGVRGVLQFTKTIVKGAISRVGD